MDKIYDFLITYLGELLSKINNFPNIIQGIGLALLTRRAEYHEFTRG